MPGIEPTDSLLRMQAYTNLYNNPIIYFKNPIKLNKNVNGTDENQEQEV